MKKNPMTVAQMLAYCKNAGRSGKEVTHYGIVTISHAGISEITTAEEAVYLFNLKLKSKAQRAFKRLLIKLINDHSNPNLKDQAEIIIATKELNTIAIASKARYSKISKKACKILGDLAPFLKEPIKEPKKETPAPTI